MMVYVWSGLYPSFCTQQYNFPMEFPGKKGFNIHFENHGNAGELGTPYK